MDPLKKRSRQVCTGFAVLAVAAAVTTIAPGPGRSMPIRPRIVKLSTYVNARFCYAVSFPPALLVPRGEAADGDGQAFVSADGRSKMVVWGSWNALDETVPGRYAAALADLKGCRVTDQVLHHDWFVLSGSTVHFRIFYEKQILKCDRWLGLWITYPFDERPWFDLLTARIARSLRPTTDCWW